MSLLLPANPGVDALNKTDQGKDSAVAVNNTCTEEHCFHAFDSLYCALTSSDPIPPKFADDKYPLFVTWNTRSSRPGRSPRLRGCIGNFEPMPIREGLAEYALVSAFRDARFKKIQESELESLECTVSLLTDFEDTSSYLDWTIGVHGIYISFPHPSLLPPSSSSSTPSPLSSSTHLLSSTANLMSSARSKQKFTACYLPDVIPDQGWNKIEAIDSAIRKAGWSGVISEDLRRNVKLRRYQSSICTVGWDEYVEWRQRNGGEIV